jgi:conjugal transfer mating pair stabilization protein TraN
MVEKQTSCCFQSQLARIMHEQGRPQLQSFSSGWGTAQNPICRGFTPEEFQALNFSIMDLSEWEASLSANMTQIEPMIQNFINSTGTDASQSIQNSSAYKAAQ